MQKLTDIMDKLDEIDTYNDDLYQKLMDNIMMNKLDEITAHNEDLHEKLIVFDSKINTMCELVIIIIGSGVGFIVASIIMDSWYY